MGEPVLVGIVVHHKSYETVASTVRGLIDCGMLQANLLVADNSEEPGRRTELESSLDGVEVLFLENKGYGAAVNAALRHLKETRGSIDFLLVATHEVQPDEAALGLLVEALDADATVGAVGPTMLIGSGAATRIWSCGGSRSRRLHAHTHVIPDATITEIQRMEPADRLWLDGAFVLYRASALPDPPFDERYFLYMEETDLHYRMRAAGWRCRWIPAAVVTQDTNLTPAYYFARNSKLFFRRNEDPLRAAVVPLILVGRDVLRRLREGDRQGARDALRGLVARTG